VPPAKPRRTRGLCGALLAAVLLTGTPASAAPAGSASLAERAEQLQARIDEVGVQLEADALAYEAAEDELALLTRRQFAAALGRDALVLASQDARHALHGLGRAAYKGGIPPVMTALLSGDPQALSDLAYVQKSINRLGADRSDVTRELVTQQADAGRRWWALRRAAAVPRSPPPSRSRSRAARWPPARRR
jgi:hypothetical protein